MNEKEKNGHFPKRPQKASAGTLRNSLKILGGYEDAPSSILSHVHLPGSEELNKLGKMLTSSIYAALQSLRDIPTRSFVAPDMDILFGSDWPGHPFRHRPLFWWRSPLEPDVTRMIGRACSSGPCSNTARQRTLSFLRALQQAIPEKPRLPVGLENASLETCCELVIQNNKRLDIVFQCKETGKAYILIEAKFDANLNNHCSFMSDT